MKQWLNIYQHNIPTTSLLINITVNRGIKIRKMIQNLNTKTTTHVTPQVYTFRTLQQLENPPLLAKGLVSALTFWKKMYSCPVHRVLWRRF